MLLAGVNTGAGDAIVPCSGGEVTITAQCGHAAVVGGRSCGMKMLFWQEGQAKERCAGACMIFRSVKGSQRGVNGDLLALQGLDNLATHFHGIEFALVLPQNFSTRSY